MFYSLFSTSREFSNRIVWRLVLGAFLLIALGVLILVVPELVVVPLAAGFFLFACVLLVFAWKIFWTMRKLERENRDFEEASFREIP